MPLSKLGASPQSGECSRTTLARSPVSFQWPVTQMTPLTTIAASREDPRLIARGHGRDRSRSPRRDSYNANPYRDQRRDEPRRSNYRRSPSPDRGFRGARDPPLGYRANDGDTETIRVRSALVGLIIGRNGENLRRVESESGAKVQFIKAESPQVSERQCTISGNMRARENAKKAIYDIIEENGGPSVMMDKGAYSAGMPGRVKPDLPELREGEKNTQIMVPDSTVGLIIGRGGETIKDLQERSGCHVNIVGENKSVNGLRPVNLIGNDVATQRAREMINEIVESDTRGSGSNKIAPQRDRVFDSQTGNGMMGAGRDWIEKTIQVPSEAVGMIIGKGGETIKDLQKTSGCKINVNSPKAPDHVRNIDLAGTSRSMEDAERVIWEKVRTVQERDAAAGRGGGGQRFDGYPQQSASAAGPSYTQYMQGPPVTHPQVPAFQMPIQVPQQQTQPQQAATDPANDPYAPWGGQQAYYAAWIQQNLANLGGQQPPSGTQ